MTQLVVETQKGNHTSFPLKDVEFKRRINDNMPRYFNDSIGSTSYTLEMNFEPHKQKSIDEIDELSQQEIDADELVDELENNSQKNIGIEFIEENTLNAITYDE